MESISAFRTSDGALFVDEIKAEKHELFLKKHMIVDEFLDSNMSPYRGPQRVIARNTIINWELWKVKNAK